MKSDEDGQVEELLERISEGTQPAERQESMDAMKGLLQTSKRAVEAFAGMGVPVLCAVIRDDQDDSDLVQVLVFVSSSHIV